MAQIADGGTGQEMLTVETIKKIRVAALRDLKPIKQIARELCISKNTVKKVLRGELTEITYERKNQHRPKLGMFVGILDCWLEAERGLPKKRQRTVKALFEDLTREGYKGAYDSVQRYVNSWRHNQQIITTQAFVPLSFDPGEAFQFDWSHEDVFLGGVPITVKVAQVRLCYSRMSLVIAYHRETQEMVFDAHSQAFKFFGGVCARGIYDNMKTVVNKILRGKNRDFNKRFEQLTSHYLFDPVACTPASGWEKGQVERLVGIARMKFFVPRPRFNDIRDLNEWLKERCIALAQSSSHPTIPEKTIWDVFIEEQAELVKVPRSFDGYAETPASVSKTSLVTFDRNRYSVFVSEVGRNVQVRAYANRVSIISNGRVVGDHKRQFGRDKITFDPWHYLALLERKPGALRNGAPFKNWDLPALLQQTRESLKRFPDSDKQFIGILCTVPTYGVKAVCEACECALGMNTMSRDVVLNLLSRGNEGLPSIPVTLPARLQLQNDPISDCTRYDALLREVNNVAQ